MATTRYRLRFTFWLDMRKSDEAALADQIELLKNERSFVRTVRDGIRLLLDLRAGHTQVLFELFPWVKNETAQPATPMHDPLLHRQLERLEEIILRQGATPIDAPKIPVPVPPGAPKPLAVPKFSLPTFDTDEEDTLVLKKTSSSHSAQNFINSMLSLQQ